MPVFKLKHGDFELDTLICTRSATMFIDSMRGVTKDTFTEEGKNEVQLLDKMISAVYFCHKAYCEDDDIPVQVKRSVIFEEIGFNPKAEGNLKKFMEVFMESMQDTTNRMAGNAEESKKKKVKPTIN